MRSLVFMLTRERCSVSCRTAMTASRIGSVTVPFPGGSPRR
jgi:hypothetical protein